MPRRGRAATAVELARATGALGVQGARVLEQPGRLHVAAEVRRVDRLAAQRLVEALGAAEGEGLGQQAAADGDEPRLVGDARPQAPEPVVDDRRVIERELGQRVDGLPGRVAVGRPLVGKRLGRDERHVGDRGQPPARVAGRVGVGAQLLEVDRADARLLAQLALRGLLRRLVRADEPARQGEGPRLRLLEAAGEQDAQDPVDEGEDDGVGRQADRRLVAG
ncbi:MAG: hypothetical protein AVDCRST_MAG30-3859 [uncultured Solirubrobacteraceae bacterium]|uniref:Uncharacterized protein n=1 Tax=uncultured Solirubrobacteraceae bacterium TaxID=1162706 RepID=A0A6J4TUC8_9ACTN|nr:MAG: hypothetical protein AVDCRST_MAG30-3859 [uncultured Solirubrobacteraceae bacterium]